MNAGVFIAALAFVLLLLGGWLLLLLAGCGFAAWFAWLMLFQKQPDDNPNGYCRDLQREIAAEAKNNTAAPH